MQNEFTKSYTHVGASFQNLALDPKSPLGSPAQVSICELLPVSIRLCTHAVLSSTLFTCDTLASKPSCVNEWWHELHRKTGVNYIKLTSL